jgi:hypothetical protein
MSKVQSYFKNILKVILWFTLVIVVVLVIVAGLLQIPVIQNKIVHQAASLISSKTNTRVEIEKIYISFRGAVVIKGIYLEDTKTDTLLYAEAISAKLAIADLMRNKINVSFLTLEGAVVNLKRVENDPQFNFNFLLEAFGDSTGKSEVAPEEGSNSIIRVDEVTLRDIRFNYDDNYGGTNINAALGILELKLGEIDLDKSVYKVDGLLLEGLTGGVLIMKSSESTEESSGNSLPVILARKIEISDADLSYADSTTKESVAAIVGHLDLEDVTIDVEGQEVSSVRVFLGNSDIRYKASEPNAIIDTADVTTNGAADNSDWKVVVMHIDLENNSLGYVVADQLPASNSFDVNHMLFEHLTLKATDLLYSAQKTEVSVKEFRTVDQNGFEITQLEGDFNMSNHSLTAKNLKTRTTHSAIDADLSIQFSSLESLGDSIATMIVDVDLKSVTVRNADILYFNSALTTIPFFANGMNTTSISGIVTGPVSDLTGKNLVIKTGVKTVLETDFTINGLPDIQTAVLDLPNLNIVSGKQDIEMFAGSVFPENFEVPDFIHISADLQGQMRAFEATVGLDCSFGEAELFAILDKSENFTGILEITNFNLGQLLKDTVMYGPLSFTAEATGRGLEVNTMEAEIKAVVPHFYLNQYNYQNLNLDGTIFGREFAGKINLNDSNAVFEFDGLVGLNPDREYYQFRLDVPGADLQKLNITKEDIRIGLLLSANLEGRTIDKLYGTVGITNLTVAKDEEVYVLDSLLFASVNEPDISKFDLSSALVGLKYSGTISPIAVAGELKSLMNHYFPFFDSVPEIEESEPSAFSFEIALHNHPILSQVLLPQLKEFEPGLITGSFDSESRELKLEATMKTITYGTTEIKDLVIDLISIPAELSYLLSSSAVSNDLVKLDNFKVEGNIADNMILVGVSSIDEDQNKKIEVHAEIIKDQSNYKIRLDPDNFWLMENRWNVASDNYIEFGDEGFLIHNLFLDNATSKINIASVNDQFNDDLSFEIQNFRLDDISGILEKDTGLLKGIVDGNALLKRIEDTYGINADIEISDLAIREVPVGTISFNAENATPEKFEIDLKLIGQDNNLTLNGYFIPDDSNNTIRMHASIRSLSMKTIEAFSMNQITESSGILSGNFLIEGTTAIPEITGDLVFSDVFFNPGFLNNRLHVKNEIILIKADGIHFDSFTLQDVNQQTAIIDGSVKMKAFKDFIFALKVTTEDFLLFNTTLEDNEVYFGKMLIDSKIDINGPLTLPVITGNLKMKEGSNFTFVVPENKLTTDRGEGVVEFYAPANLNPILYRDEKESIESTGLKGFDLSAIIEVDKQATLRLLMDPSSTDSLVVRGEAALNLTIDKSGKVSLTGAYNINEGSYLVSLQSVIKKKFDIDKGSTIVWNGDPLEAELFINATYTVRASPIDLVAGQLAGLSDVDKAAYKQRFPFWVLLKLRGQLLHPEIGFEIQLPPGEKGILGGTVNAKLNLLNEEPSLLNQQVFALLVLGRFIQENPLHSDANIGASTVVRSTVGKFISAQLNQLSSRVVSGVELNFDIQSYDDYGSGQAEGRTEVEIGVTKELFNERLTVQVGGTVDVEGDHAQQNSANDITSDVTVEYKLTSDGRYRLKGFRNSVYEGAIEGQIVETGVGVSYVRDFFGWKELFRMPKKTEVIDKQSQKK